MWSTNLSEGLLEICNSFEASEGEHKIWSLQFCFVVKVRNATRLDELSCCSSSSWIFLPKSLQRTLPVAGHFGVLQDSFAILKNVQLFSNGSAGRNLSSSETLALLAKTSIKSTTATSATKKIEVAWNTSASQYQRWAPNSQLLCCCIDQFELVCNFNNFLGFGRVCKIQHRLQERNQLLM